MYRKMSDQIDFFEYTKEAPFKLDPENRWMKKAKIVPWKKAEEKYMHMFRKHGRNAKDIRMALGALIIQQTLRTSDEETVEQIIENPYLQYFIGLHEFTNEKPFNPSLMVWFRKRLSVKFMAELNEEMCKAQAHPKEDKNEDKGDNDNTPHGGTLILDATCTPADITYPTDTGLLGKAIEKTDLIIDELHKPNKGEEKRPRTYRQISRKVFTGISKQRQPSGKTIRKCIRKQLGYLKRNITIIEQMVENGGKLTVKQDELYKTIQEIYKQQSEMYKTNRHSVPERIVSISQPHIRPIVRGKASAKVEFGAKVSVSVVNGYTFLDKISFDTFNEGTTLEECVERYKKRFGMLPKIILADTIYRSRGNLRYCKENGIRLSGRPLGRPPKKPIKQGLYEKADTAERNEIEGRIGHLKNDYGLERIMARLPETSKAVIAVAVFAMNLHKRAKSLLRNFFKRLLFQDFIAEIAA